ncbi:hypothetical protein ACH4ZU_28320 [Streptomyces sp. NPDC020472]|uniref:hypothetical protein n=1 Tax=Streptomyces sp. NPDC020472 TaxID=3365075 RepID=UPI00379221C6
MGYGPTSNMLVNLVGGCTRAKDVAPGRAMWTLDGDRTVQTTVVDVTAVKGRQAVDVVTDHMTFTAGPDLLLLTPEGWKRAVDVAGRRSPGRTRGSCAGSGRRSGRGTSSATS